MDSIIKEMRGELIPVYGKGETEAIIRIIFKHLKGWSPVDIALHDDADVSDFVRSEIRSIIERLLKHEPIQYIVGETEFYGLNIKVKPGVLIPRPETAELVDIIVDENKDSDLRVLDACTGSGCIALALSRNLRFPKILAVDISEDAFLQAGENAKLLHCDVEIRKADIFRLSLPDDSLDIIVSNPPYVGESEKKDMTAEVLDYEPSLALFVPDDDVLRYYRRLYTAGRDWLVAGGKIYFEVNPLHAVKLADEMRDSGYSDVEIINDIHGRQRFIKAEKC